jgi:hypothetical protein
VVNLTEDEITRCSQDLARVTTQQAELEEEKKTVTSGFKEKIDRCVSDSRCLARKISTRQDVREVECEWRMDYTARMAYLYRIDTLEEVERRKLTADELQEELKFKATDDVDPAEEDEVTTCTNIDCKDFDKSEPNGCAMLVHVCECPRATGGAA